MMKVFLVEDEIVMREGIKNNINWAEEGFQFVGEASDGELAYPMIQKLKPDILITDIKMPFMNGLELSSLVKKEMPGIKIIILSGYDEFEFAKKAINIGVTDYLVKPIAGAKLLEAVKNVAGTIEVERKQQDYLNKFRKEMLENEHIQRQRFFNDLISNKLSVSEILENGKKLEIDLSAEEYTIFLFKLFLTEDEEDQYSEDMIRAGEEIEAFVVNKADIIMFDRSTEGWAFLVEKREEQEIEEIVKQYLNKFIEMVSRYPNVEYFGGVGVPVSRLREVPKSFDEANKSFAYRYILKKNQIIYQDFTKGYKLIPDADINLSNLDVGKMDRKVVENFLKSGSKSEVHHFVEEYFASIGETNINSVLFRQYITMDMYFCAVSVAEALGYNAENIIEKCGEFSQVPNIVLSVESTKEYLEKIFTQVIGLRDLIAIKKYSDIIERAKAYIEDNHEKEEISLNTVAASVNISPSHFSTIFSQETGQTFIEYLTGVRMEKAKELLRCSGMKSSEIGYAVGYKDPHYFSYLFKKTQECNPREFRLRCKE